MEVFKLECPTLYFYPDILVPSFELYIIIGIDNGWKSYIAMDSWDSLSPFIDSTVYLRDDKHTRASLLL